MAGQTERGLMGERVAVLAMWLGAIALVAGVASLGGVLLGIEPAAPLAPGPMGAALPGLVLAFLGLGLVLRGMTLSLAAETLANVRLLQEETHRARTQAAMNAHAVREPMTPLRPAARTSDAPVHQKPKASQGASAGPPLQPAARVKVVTSDAPLPTVARPGLQPERKASQKAPITGKPFQPHPIFMSRPLR
jgi:hypothetical protein